MIRNLTLISLLLLATLQALGQAANSCVQTLRLAQSTYESGRLHELPDMLKQCLDNGFNVEERRQAYKLLVQSYIYLEEPEEADKAMLSLLDTDHFFEPNVDVDPAEFVSLWKRFRTKPLFRIGGKLGPSFNAPSATVDYSVGSGSEGTTQYSPQVSFFFGVVFEKDFLEDKATGKDRLAIAPELVFSSRKYKEVTTTFTPDNSEETTKTQFDGQIKITWIEVNPLVKWWVAKNNRLIEPYIIAGPGVNFVTNASLDLPKLNHEDGTGTNTGPSIDITDCYKLVNMSAIIGAGFRYRFGPIYVVPDIRIQYGLTNIVNGEKRSNPEAVWEYSWVPNDSRISSITFNLGIQYAAFSPKKLIK